MAQPVKPNQTRGTQPLGKPTGSQPLPPAPATPAPAGPTRPASTGQLQTSDRVGLTPASAAAVQNGLGAGLAQPAAPPIYQLGNLATHLLTGMGVNALVQRAEQVVHTVDEGIRFAGEFVTDPRAAVQHEVEEVLDRNLGVPQAAYVQHEKLTGFISEITTRLRPGHGAFVTASGGVTIPSQTLATALSLGLGGEVVPNLGFELQTTAAVERRPDGKLRVMLTMRAAESASHDVGVGVQAGLQRNGQTLIGINAGASASAAATASQLGQIELVFDPKVPADAARMSGLFSSHSLPPSSSVNPQGLAQAFQHNLQSVTLGASLSAHFTAKAELSAGVGGQAAAPGAPAGAPGAPPRVVNHQMGGFNFARTEMQRGKAPTVAGLGAQGPQIGGSVSGGLGLGAGGALTWRRDGSTQAMGYVAFNAQASAKGSLPLVGAQSVNLVRKALRAATGSDRDINDVAAIKVDTDASGRVRAAVLEFTHIDARGQTIAVQGKNGQIERHAATDAMRRTRIELTPAGLAALGSSPPTPEHLMALLATPANFVTRTSTASASNTSYGGSFDANLGIGRINLHGQVAAGTYEFQGDGTDLDPFARQIITGAGGS